MAKRKGKRVVMRWDERAACGCLLKHYTHVRVRTSIVDHKATSKRLPIVCPVCRAETYALFDSVRRA
jgi:hypothetical protein